MNWIFADGSTFDKIDPSTGKPTFKIANGNSQIVNRAVLGAQKALQTWRKTTPEQRSQILLTAAFILEEQAQSLGYLESRDLGKPIREAIGDPFECAGILRYAAGPTRCVMGTTHPQGSSVLAVVKKEPIGVVGVITPFNFPLCIATQKISSVLAAGCTCVVKPSEKAPVNTMNLAKIFTAAGVPPGVIQVVNGTGEVGAMLSSHPGISKVTFTGSTATGKKIMTQCAQNLTPSVMELGGKSPLLIMEDANLEKAVETALVANYFCNGQVCSACTRILIHESLVQKFLELAKATLANRVIGPSAEEKNTLGPLIDEAQYNRVLGLLQGAKNAGVKVICGGDKYVHPDPNFRGGYYIQPTILLADSDNYEIVLTKAHRIAEELESGVVWINTYFAGDSSVPFEGVKGTGFGKEGGLKGIEEFMVDKSLVISYSD